MAYLCKAGALEPAGCYSSTNRGKEPLSQLGLCAQCGGMIIMYFSCFPLSPSLSPRLACSSWLTTTWHGAACRPKRKKTQRKTHNTQNAHRNRQTIRQRNTPHTLEKPTQRPIHHTEPLLATKGNNSKHLSNNAAWFLSVKGRQRAHILDMSEQSYSDRAEEERPPSKLQNVKQMTHAWYAGNIPDVWLLMGGKWKSIFTFHPTSTSNYRSLFLSRHFWAKDS